MTKNKKNSNNKEKNKLVKRIVLPIATGELSGYVSVHKPSEKHTYCLDVILDMVNLNNRVFIDTLKSSFDEFCRDFKNENPQLEVVRTDAPSFLKFEESTGVHYLHISVPASFDKAEMQERNGKEFLVKIPTEIPRPLIVDSNGLAMTKPPLMGRGSIIAIELEARMYYCQQPEQYAKTLRCSVNRIHGIQLIKLVELEGSKTHKPKFDVVNGGYAATDDDLTDEEGSIKDDPYGS